MTPIEIRKGIDIPIAGAPKPEIITVPPAERVAVYQEFEGVKAKIWVKEGDHVKRGTPLFASKRQLDLNFCSPVAGTVQAIEYGPRRALYRILIDRDPGDAAEAFEAYTPDRIRGLDRETIIAHLQRTGLFSLIKQRPFSRISDPEVTPRAIYVNGMNTAPFSPDIHVAVTGRERAFQAGLDLLTRLTNGAVYLSLAANVENPSGAVTNAKHVRIQTFAGPHPAGNTSVHIHHLDPMEPTDKVWTIRATDVIRLGALFLDGSYPAQQVITLAGPGVREADRAHYAVEVGTPFAVLFKDRLTDAEQRVVAGDLLAGQERKRDEHVLFASNAINIVSEGREQFFMGWLAPGINKLSASKTYLSGWTGHRRKWDLTTCLNGSYRSMVLTGLYDKYVPLDIMVDYLVRAVLAHDTDEAIKLGILGTDPEDFSLCSYVCPSKMDICGIVKQGLEEIEKEGI